MLAELKELLDSSRLVEGKLSKAAICKGKKLLKGPLTPTRSRNATHILSGSGCIFWCVADYDFGFKYFMRKYSSG